MRRILVIGSMTWTDQRVTLAALRRAEETFRPPYTLVCDGSDGAARFALAAARKLGWEVEVHQVDNTKCGPMCPPTMHRRHGGPDGDWCPTAVSRNQAMMFDSQPDVCIALMRPQHRDGVSRVGQYEARKRGVGLWEYTQKAGGGGNGVEAG